MPTRFQTLIYTCTLSLSLYSPYASASWWEKGLEIFNEQTQNDSDTQTDSTSSLSFSNEQLSRAFKQALDIGSSSVVQNLAKKDAFRLDESIHIPLPEEFTYAQSWLKKAGLGDSLNSLENKLNEAAERATPEAKALFKQAINDMSFEDVYAIYKGSDDAATRYFEERMTPQLTTAMQPIVNDALNEVGALQLYNNIIADYQNIPFVPDLQADLNSHVVEKGLQGIFYYIAKEEKSIRSDPSKWTTQLLKDVFSNL